MTGLALTAQLPAGFDRDDVRSVLNGALRREAELARARRTYFERACRTFEEQFGLTSDEFMRQFESGSLGDAAGYFDWYAAKRGLWTCGSTSWRSWLGSACERKTASYCEDLMLPTALSFPYDVFISYSHTDAAWVMDRLVPRLKDAGLKVCTDQESFDLGVPSLINMENAVAASRHTLLVLTPAYVASEWTMFEQILTQTQDPAGLRQRTIPVLLSPCSLPMRIAMLTYADLTGTRDEEAEFAKIVRAIGGTRGTPPRTPSKTSAPPAVVTPASSPAPNTAAIRELLAAAFSDEELTTFCFDSFPPVHGQFSIGMSRTQKIQALVEHCVHHGEVERLLALVQKANNHQYRQFASRLRA